MNVEDIVFRELDKLGLKEEVYQPTENVEASEVILDLPPDFRSLTIKDDTREYKQAVRYAIKRGITAHDVIKYNLGYCTVGRFKDRIIFPSYDKNNRLNFFTGRSYYDDVYLKYDNCDVSKDVVGFENMIDFNYPVSLVEGPLDAIAVKRNVSPLFGTYLSKKLKMVLVENQTEVNLILDPDAVKLSLDIADFLLSVGLKLKLVEVRNGDAGSMGFRKITQLIKETDYLDFTGIMRLRLEI